METEAASTAARTRTRAPRVAATRSTPCTRTAARASVSRPLCRAPAYTLPPGPRGPGPASTPPCPRSQEGGLREIKSLPGIDGQLSVGTYPLPSATQDRAPLLRVAAGFLRVLSSMGGGGPSRWSVGRRKVCAPGMGSVLPEAQVFPPNPETHSGGVSCAQGSGEPRGDLRKLL